MEGLCEVEGCGSYSAITPPAPPPVNIARIPWAEDPEGEDS